MERGVKSPIDCCIVSSDCDVTICQLLVFTVLLVLYVVGHDAQGGTDSLYVTSTPRSIVEAYRIYSQVYCGFLLAPGTGLVLTAERESWTVEIRVIYIYICLLCAAAMHLSAFMLRSLQMKAKRSHLESEQKINIDAGFSFQTFDPSLCVIYL